MSTIFGDVDAAVDATLARIGPQLVLGVPLGLGKPVPFVNALYRRAESDPALRLRILTALTLEKPRGSTAVERAFLEPFVQRVYGDCPDPAYMAALREHRLPPNVEVAEFYFRPGAMLNNAHAQQHYISSNYTHAARDVFAQGVNVVAQMVAKRTVDGEVRYSLSCNPDTGLELVERLVKAGRRFVSVAVVNEHLPYLEGTAEVPGDFFDFVVDAPTYSHTLFSTPKQPVATPDFCIGLHASSLVRDGGTLQLGIGGLGDGLVHALLLRHTRNDAYRAILDDVGVNAELGETLGGRAPFATGVYGASEMMVDGFMNLHRAGILKRRVYGFWALQQLVNEGRCDPQRLTPALFEDLESLGVRVIRTQDFEVLQLHGVFTDETRYHNGYIVAPDGERVIANVADPQTRRVLGERCLGPRLRNGTVLNAAFYLGTNEFYEWLRTLPDEQRREIGMTSVARVNQLDLNPRLYQQQRVHARFMNAGLMATLSGAIVSDGLEDGRVVSGVGGQYNFVAMAHQLAGGRSILMIRATREVEGRPPTSNIVFNYGHATIPRHLRDLVVTEYGVADLRSKSDREIIVALLNVTDSRFQDALLARAKGAGKIEIDYRIPERHCHNTPDQLERLLAPHRALFPAYPLGTDFTQQEQVLVEALRRIGARAARGRIGMLWDAFTAGDATAADEPYLQRLDLAAPVTFQARILRKLLVRELRAMSARPA